MNKVSIVHQVVLGIRQHPGRFALAFPLAFAALWGILEPIVTKYVALLTPQALVILAVGALIVACFQVQAPSEITLRWHPLGLTVTVKVGDLFQQDAGLVITSDDLFLVKDQKLVNPRSLIGQLVDREYRSKAEDLDSQIQQALAAQVHAEEAPGRRHYPIGTTAVIRNHSHRIFIMALCQVSRDGTHGSASAEDLLLALQQLWRTVAREPTGKPVAVPLVGTGQTGAGLSAPVALHIMLTSLVVSARKQPITDHIQIIVHPSAFDGLDLRGIRDAWQSAGAAAT